MWMKMTRIWIRNRAVVGRRSVPKRSQHHRRSQRCSIALSWNCLIAALTSPNTMKTPRCIRFAAPGCSINRDPIKSSSKYIKTRNKIQKFTHKFVRQFAATKHEKSYRLWNVNRMTISWTISKRIEWPKSPICRHAKKSTSHAYRHNCRSRKTSTAPPTWIKWVWDSFHGILTQTKRNWKK